MTNTALIDGMAELALERLHRSIGQRARRAKEAIARRAADERRGLEPRPVAPGYMTLRAEDMVASTITANKITVRQLVRMVKEGKAVGLA
jgi:hypothetical protein